jgi:hypothetical protein
VLGAHAWLGRTLEPADEDGDARLVVLTYGLWQRVSAVTWPSWVATSR